MRGLVRLLVGMAVCCGTVWLSAQQAPVFRAGTETVPVFVTVIESDGRLATDLKADSFQILDNGRPQKITLFDATIQPVSIVIMLDMSGSMSGNIHTLRTAAVQMFTRLLPADKARVGNFGNRIDIEPNHFTNDVDELTRALWLDLEPGGPTPLWGALNAAMTALAHLDGRRVVLVLTDGKNTGLRMSPQGVPMGPTLKEIMDRAESEDFMIYSIGMRSSSGGFRGQGYPPGLGGRGGFGGGRGGRGGGRGGGSGESDEPDPGIRQLADASGGGYFELQGTTNLGEAFAKVADELHRQYLIGYAMPEADGKVHHIDIRLADPTMQARARRTYIATKKQ
jgi:Ca-activated chloride channel homolog